MLERKTFPKRDLHLELKYSPDLPFYKEDPYYHSFRELLSLFNRISAKTEVKFELLE
jgi:hypothetical protein